MKRSSLVLAVSGFLFAGPLFVAAMDNKDVIKMHKAGLSDDTILAAMQKEKADYKTDTDALIELKGAGVSEKLIQTMLKLQSSSSTAPAAPAAAAGDAGPAAASAPAAGGAFWKDFPSIAPAKTEAAIGKDYFTRYSFHEEKNEHSTTNYSRGGLVPINTPVKLISMSGNKLTLKRLDTGQEIKVENEPKYTKRSIAEIANLMLSEEKTPLEKLPDEVATAIRNGDLRKGMTKELAIMARGYPPAHETASLESDRWVYWSSRFVKLTVVFTNGRVSDGRGLY
jgi:hypothetical protein